MPAMSANCSHPDVTYRPDSTRVCAWCDTPVGDDPNPTYRAALKERVIDEFDKNREQ